MMKAWFTESAIGLDITDSGIVAVRVTSSGLFGPDRFVIDKLQRCLRKTDDTDSDLVADVLKEFGYAAPVIPLVCPAVCHRETTGREKTVTVTDFQKTIKPLLQSGGKAWFDIEDILVADTGDWSRILHAINHWNTIETAVPGAVSLLGSLVALHSITQTSDALYVHARPPGYTLVALINGSVHYCRTVYCPADELPNAIEAAFATLHTTHPDRALSAIVRTGTPCDSPVISPMRTPIPVVEWSQTPTGKHQNNPKPLLTVTAEAADISPSIWAAPAGAAIAWMMKGSKASLKDIQNRSTGGGIPASRRSTLLLRSAGLLFLLCLLCWITASLAYQKNQVRLLNASVQQNISAKQSNIELPSIPHLPQSVNGLRYHAHLSAIADLAARYDLILNDISITLNRMDIQGSGQDITDINGFSRDLSRYFADIDATVRSPITHRGLSNRPAFRLEILWDDTR